jgi:hypothetical protein
VLGYSKTSREECWCEECAYCAITPIRTLLMPCRNCCSPTSGKCWPIHHIAQTLHQVKESLAGKNFSDDDEVQDAVMTWLREQVGFLRRCNKKTRSQAH